MARHGANPLLTAALWLPACLLWTLVAALSLCGAPDVDDVRTDGPSSDRFIIRGSAPPDVALAVRHRFAPPDVPYWPLKAGPAPRSSEATVDMVEHQVEFGQTLTSIVRGYLGPSARYEPTAEANGLTEPYRLQAGQRIAIAGTIGHRSRKKATLLAPAETRGDSARRSILGHPANPPPESAFVPLEAGLELERPWSLAFAWWVPVGGLAIFSTVAAVALLRNLGRSRLAEPAVLAWCAVTGGGGFALAGAVAVLLSLGGLPAGLVASAAAGTSVRFGAAPREAEPLRAFAFDVAALLSIAAFTLWITGVLQRASEAIALP